MCLRQQNAAGMRKTVSCSNNNVGERHAQIYGFSSSISGNKNICFLPLATV